MSTIKSYLGSPVVVIQDLPDGSSIISATEIVETAALEVYTLPAGAPGAPVPPLSGTTGFPVPGTSVPGTTGFPVPGTSVPPLTGTTGFGADAPQPLGSPAPAVVSADYSGPDRRIFTRRVGTERRHG